MPNDPLITLGLMSGTSLDGVDAVAMAFTENDFRVLGHAYMAYPEHIIAESLKLATPGFDECQRMGALGIELARIYAQAIHECLDKTGLTPKDVTAVGVHGQTIRHCPHNGFSVQLNSPAHIAEYTGLNIIADFRSRDLAAGGQGAPLVPAFHKECFTGDKPRVILNLGGIANITCLSAREEKAPPLGGDTGPANMLLDHWMQTRFGLKFDANGQEARQGKVNDALLQSFLSDPYFKRPLPKSTGREVFNGEWLEHHLAHYQHISAQDVARTLVELTARSVVEAIRQTPYQAQEIYVCGGGARNPMMLEALEANFGHRVETTEALGMPPMLVEAAAFAWLAMRFIRHEPGNQPEATGAQGPRILGCLYPA